MQEEQICCSHQSARPESARELRRLKWAVTCCLIGLGILSVLSVYQMVGGYLLRRDKVSNESALNPLLHQDTNFSGRPSAHLTGTKQDYTNSTSEALQWEDHRGLAFTIGIKYNNRSLHILKAGYYFVYSQVSFRHGVSLGQRVKKLEHVGMEIRRINDNYPVPECLLSGAMMLEKESEEYRPIYLGALLHLIGGDRILVYVTGRMTTLDEKLMGEKCQYYYSSSDDEDSDQGHKSQVSANEPDKGKDGSVVNTGPKGVINDWRRYKQLENEQNDEQHREMEHLIKKLSMTCKSHLDEEKERQNQKKLEEKIHGKMTMQEYNMLNDDEDFLQQYRKQRIAEMKKQLCQSQLFKEVLDIRSGEDFLDNVDKEQNNTIVIILIYEDDIPGSEAINGCIICLASEYPGVKFCRVKSSLLGTSTKFTENALPALLVYKAGELIGNFVRITDQLGEDFFAVDLEAFLHECGLLPEKDSVRFSVCNPSVQCFSDDSDLEID